MSRAITTLRGHWQLIAIAVAIFMAWQTPVIVPLKILTVFFHEISHAAASWATGGEVLSISVSAQQGGVTVTRGGNLFFILSAGYLGSLAIGMLLFVIALRSRADRILMAILGVVLLGLAGLYIREIFALSFAVGMGGVMLLAARFLPNNVNDMALRVIGLTSMLYVPLDIYDDTIARVGERSDAYVLAKTFGGTTMLWGGVWLLISLAVIGAVLRYGLGGHSNITSVKTAPPMP